MKSKIICELGLTCKDKGHCGNCHQLKIGQGKYVPEFGEYNLLTPYHVVNPHTMRFNLNRQTLYEVQEGKITDVTSETVAAFRFRPVQDIIDYFTQS